MPQDTIPTRPSALMPAFLMATLAASGCISTESEVLDATEGCEEFDADEVEDLDIDADAKAFIMASLDVEQSVNAVSDDVLEACAGIATDLGAPDTWSDLESMKRRKKERCWPRVSPCIIATLSG